MNWKAIIEYYNNPIPGERIAVGNGIAYNVVLGYQNNLDLIRINEKEFRIQRCEYIGPVPEEYRAALPDNAQLL